MDEVPDRLEHIIERLSDRLADSTPAKSTLSQWVPAFLVLVGWLASLAFIWGTTTQRMDTFGQTLTEIKVAVKDFPLVQDHQKQTEEHVQNLQKDVTELKFKVDSVQNYLDGLGLKPTRKSTAP